MNSYIKQAKVMSKGQIIIPQEICKLLGLKNGDKVSFIVNGDQVMLANSSICALKLLQTEMKGEAEKAELFDEDDVQNLIEENR